MPPVLPLVLGLSGPQLTETERNWLAEHRPAAFLLFARNIQSPQQVQALTAQLAAFSPWPQPLIAVDQEGSRVQRLTFYGRHPAARVFGDWWHTDAPSALRACTLNAMLLADGLRAVGATWLLGPVLDLPTEDAHAIIGNRAFGTAPSCVTALADAFLQGLQHGGVYGCLKHAPGHGRATVDSHAELPSVSGPLEQLQTHDFAPFAALATQCPFVMTAHIRFPSIDAHQPITTSPAGVALVQSWGGQLGPTSGQIVVADDVGMAALGGAYPARVQAALGAGCGLVITALSHIPHGMAGTVYAADAAAALHTATIPAVSLAVAARLQALPVLPRLSRPAAHSALRELQSLWAQGPGLQGMALELTVART
jgi:beta-N-acetylhexosaminidase